MKFLSDMNIAFLLCVFKFVSGKNCFNFLRRRLPREKLKALDKLVSLRCNISRELVRLEFLNSCMKNSVYPKNFIKTLRKDQILPSRNSLKRLTSSYIDTTSSKLQDLRNRCSSLEPLLDELNIICRIKFCRFVWALQAKTKAKFCRELNRSLSTEPLENSFPPNPERYIMNLSNVTLTDLQRETLSLGLKYCVPFHKYRRIETMAQFENLFDQLGDLSPKSDSGVSWVKAKLIDVANQYHVTPMRQTSLLSKRHLESLEELRQNPDLVITQPDKGSGVVLMNRTDYCAKIMEILRDSCKFKDDTKPKQKVLSWEREVTKRLNGLFKAGRLTKQVVEELKPCGSQLPQLYGLPKTHKASIPLRPILSMINSPCHKLAKWLSKILEPVRQRLVKHTVRDTFDFVERIKGLNIRRNYMVSFDATSLFTNVPLRFTVDLICANAHGLPIEPRDLKDLLLLCTENVPFMFDGHQYVQHDGVAMGSPLGPIFADIFVAHIEEKVKSLLDQTKLYVRYVDDCFCLCKSRRQAVQILRQLNQAHPNLRFTMEQECDNQLAFLDVLVSRNPSGEVDRKVYHKSTWTGQYLHFSSFTPIHHKRALVKTLYSRARKICSPENLEDELNRIKLVLGENGYPRKFIERHSMTSPGEETISTVKKKQVHLRLPFKGDDVTQRVKRRLRGVIERVYPAAEINLISSTNRIKVPPVKTPLPFLARSNVIYRCTCVCGATYVGRTERHLEKRISEHLPSWLINAVNKTPRSSITKHILDTGHSITRDSFSVITHQKNRKLLRFSEAASIWIYQPALCIQKDFVTQLALPW